MISGENDIENISPVDIAEPVDVVDLVEPVDPDGVLYRWVAEFSACDICRDHNGEVGTLDEWGDDWRPHPHCFCILELV